MITWHLNYLFHVFLWPVSNSQFHNNPTGMIKCNSVKKVIEMADAEHEKILEPYRLAVKVSVYV